MFKVLLVFSLIAVGFAAKSGTTLDSSGIVLSVQNQKRNKFVLAFANDVINNFNLTIEVNKRNCIKVSLDDCNPLQYLLPGTDINGNWGLQLSPDRLVVSKDGVRVVNYWFEDLCYQKMWLAGDRYRFSTQHIPGKVEVKSIDDKTLPNCSFTYVPDYYKGKKINAYYCTAPYYVQCTCNGLEVDSETYCSSLPQPRQRQYGEVDCRESFSERCLKQKDEHGALTDTICLQDPFKRCHIGPA